ncbi:MAG: Na/Pi cotransporter family protein [Lachnospiraceae bacterium]|nr:Na/Pi cotransporter family protein [Lachnospiraceae bacterium]MBR3808001.1 Na/Pi cotransporter family protein [Lachnospiraceae bacterium]
MTIFDALSMVGGLALFLYGMHIMGEGLSKASGGKLESLLEKLTSNRIKAVLVGAGVTAVIQSSSATTVMVVGFVNSGIMKLSQAVGIIMGANIGTTATSWLLSLSSIDGSSFLVQLLKPANFSPILAVIGVIFIMFCKSEKKKDVALILIGFAILMTGMDTMSAAVEPLKDVPEFTNILTMFSNPVLGLLAGAALTAVIQSSSASVGILQALCATGAIGFSTAIPIIMGQNIGTCVTAMLSSVGGSKNARRTALVHLYFNLIGTVIFMIGFYALNAVVAFPFMSQSIDAAGIATIHTIFNVFATCILLPFGRVLEKLATISVPDDVVKTERSDFENNIRVLDARFLDTPGYAISMARSVTIKMAEAVYEAMTLAMNLIKEYNEEAGNRVIELEEEVDRYEDLLGAYLLKISSKDLSEKESHQLTVMLHCINDFERIADHAINIKESAEEKFTKGLQFSEKAAMELEIFGSAIQEIVDITVSMFKNDDLNMASRVEPLEEIIDDLSVDMKTRHVTRLRKGTCTIELGFVLQDLTTNFERVADHCSNIALYVLQENEEHIDAHEFMENIKKSGDIAFERQKMYYRNRYKLPQTSVQN